MRKIISILALMAAFCSHAQPLVPKWEVALESNVQWLEVTDWGILIAAANDGLYGINPESGEKLWKEPELTRLKRDNYRTLPGTPIAILEDGPLLIALNSVTGQVIVNSRKAGFEKITNAEVVAASSGLLVAYKNDGTKGLALFDLTSGDLKWKNDFSGLKGSSEIQPAPQVTGKGDIIYAFGKNLLLVSGSSGETIWQKEAPKDIKDLFFDPAGTMIVAVSGSVSNAFRRDNTEGIASTSVQGNTGKFNIQAFALADGSEKWSLKYKSKYAGVAAGDTDFILFHAFSINFIDFATGKQRWKKEPKYVGGGRSTALIVDEKGILYAMESAITESKTYIYYLDHDGNKLWKKAPYTSTGIYQLERVPKGILYISPNGANIVDERSGKEIWEGDKYLSSGGIPILLNEDKNGNPLAIIRGQVLRILPETGDWEVLADDVSLYGDVPQSFRRVEGGYRITSPQNALMVDENGKKLYHTYYPAPGQSFGKRMLLSLASVAVTVASISTVGASAVGYGVVGELQDRDDYREKSAGYYDLFAVGAGAGDGLAMAAQRRFKEQIDAPDYKLILAKKEKNIGLIKVDLTTGKEAGFVITEDRTPEFVLDQVDDKLFFKSAPARIAAYEM